MKYIEVDEELYRYIASKTEQIGESASTILRRLLGISALESNRQGTPEIVSQPSFDAASVTNNLNTVYKGKLPAKAIGPAKYEDLNFDSLVNDNELALQKGAVGRFLFLLESLYLASPQNFSEVLKIQGRDRLYFATSKMALLESSKTSNPKEIGSSGFWVISNNNTAKKRNILLEVLELFGCKPDQANKLAAYI